MGKIAKLAKEIDTGPDPKESVDVNLMDYLSNLTPIQYLGNLADDIAKYFGLEHGLSGTIARYLEDKEGLNDPNFIGNPEYTGYRNSKEYKDSFHRAMYKKYALTPRQYTDDPNDLAYPRYRYAGVLGPDAYDYVGAGEYADDLMQVNEAFKKKYGINAYDEIDDVDKFYKEKGALGHTDEFKKLFKKRVEELIEDGFKPNEAKRMAERELVYPFRPAYTSIWGWS